MLPAGINCIGAVLAGGKSSRMGCDKASLRINNESLLLRARNTLLDAGCCRVVLSGHIRPDWKWEAIGDISPDGGPSSGIASTIIWAHEHKLDGAKLIFVPVDTPLLSSSLLSDLAEVANRGNACTISGHPLPTAIKVTSSAADLSRRINIDLINGVTWSIKCVLDKLGATPMPINRKISTQLVNTNTPSDWESLCHELENRT